jgi:hypothetical protein
MTAMRNSQRNASPVRLSQTNPLAPVMLLLVLIPLLFLIAWIVHLELTLPEVREPRDQAGSERLPGHALASPGNYSITEVDLDTEGEWIHQEIGDRTWLATDNEGARQRLAFFGSDLFLIARIGPEAGRAYIRVNDRAVDFLPSDEGRSFIGLWAGQASDQTIHLASGLAHGEHLVEIVAAGDGEVAIAGFEVVSETPFPWAFVLAYLGLGLGMLLITRHVLIALSSSTATLKPDQHHAAENDR